MDITINYTPNEKQSLFHESGCDEVVYGGAKGGGKSCALVMECLAYGLEHNGAEMYIFRETYDDLEANIIREWKEKVPKELYSYNESKHTATLVNSSVVKFRYIRNFQDAEGYQGRSMDWIGIDELTKHEERSIQVLLSCMRSPKGFPPRFRATCNPGGIGHVWVKDTYIDATHHGDNVVVDEVTGNTRQFIPAKVWDNVVLMENDPAYVKRLQNLPDAQRKAFLDGDWDIFEGQFFTNFNKDVRVIQPFSMPEWWKRYRVFDYGLDMFACYFIAIDDRGIGYVYKEIYESNLIISQAASLMNERTIEPIERTYAPPDMWNRRNDTGRSAADIFYENGVMLYKADNNRANGCSAMNEWFTTYEGVDEFTGETKELTSLYIFTSCPNLIRTVPQLLTDDTNPNVYATEPHEITHAPDALRYFCVMQSYPSSKPHEIYDDPYFISQYQYEQTKGMRPVKFKRR